MKLRPNMIDSLDSPLVARRVGTERRFCPAILFTALALAGVLACSSSSNGGAFRDIDGGSGRNDGGSATPDAGSTETGPGSGGGQSCGKGPFSEPSSDGETSCKKNLGCPSAPPSTAAQRLMVATCSVTGKDKECTPIPLPFCARDSVHVSLSLVNPKAPMGNPGCAGTLDVDSEVSVTGGATLKWHALEKEPIGCTEVGQGQSGTETVPGPCCEVVRDIYFPMGDFTVRVAVRTDWQPG